MGKMVFFNIAWMSDYQGITINDIPKHGGTYINENKFGAEVYNFQPFNGKMYGFVEAGWKPTPRCINIAKNFGASKQAQSVDGVLVVWVARHPSEPKTLVVGWYKNATVYRGRQDAPLGSPRKLPDGTDAVYFAMANEKDCVLVPLSLRSCDIPRTEKKKSGLGQKNIWYAKDELGLKTKLRVLEYIRNYVK